MSRLAWLRRCRRAGADRVVSSSEEDRPQADASVPQTSRAPTSSCGCPGVACSCSRSCHSCANAALTRHPACGIGQSNPICQPHAVLYYCTRALHWDQRDSSNQQAGQSRRMYALSRHRRMSIDMRSGAAIQDEECMCGLGSEWIMALGWHAITASRVLKPVNH